MKRMPGFTVAVLVCISVVVYWSQHRRIRQLESENHVLVLERDLADADRQAQVPPANPPPPEWIQEAVEPP